MNEPETTYRDWLSSLAWELGAPGPGYDKSRPLWGYLKLAFGVFPHFRIGRYKGHPFIDLIATRFPLRRCAADGFWSLGLLIARDDDGWHTMRYKGDLG